MNGKVRPYFRVETALYRFRVLNAANSRFYALSLTGDRAFHQIGSDQGLLAAPVRMQKLILAPGERADLLIDFTGDAGQTMHLRTGVEAMLEFRISSGAAHNAPQTPTALVAVPRLDPATAVRTRTISLHEYDNKAGQPRVMLLNRKTLARSGDGNCFA